MITRKNLERRLANLTVDKTLNNTLIEIHKLSPNGAIIHTAKPITANLLASQKFHSGHEDETFAQYRKREKVRYSYFVDAILSAITKLNIRVPYVTS